MGNLAAAYYGMPEIRFHSGGTHVNRMATAGDARIMEQYKIAPERMGAVYSALLLAYTIGMIPGGLFIDRFGPKAALTALGFGSALLVALTGVVGLILHDGASVLLGLVVVRGLLGVVFTPLHPGAARAVTLWVPPTWRSRTNGLVNGSALLGIAATPLGFEALIDRFGWPFAFVVAGALTAALALVWAAFAAGAPARPAAPRERRPPAEPWRALLRRRSLVLLTLSYGAVGYFQYLFFYWMRYYFETVLRLPEATSRVYAALPPLAMAAGMPLGGWLSDRVESAVGAPEGRAVVPMAGMTAGALAAGPGGVRDRTGLGRVLALAGGSGRPRVRSGRRRSSWAAAGVVVPRRFSTRGGTPAVCSPRS